MSEELDLGGADDVWAVDAEYHEPRLERYGTNPLLEALPPIYTSKEVAKGMTYRPVYVEAERSLSPEERQHAAGNVLSFVQPLSIHIDGAHRLSRLLRDGLIPRNPARPRYRAETEAGLDAFRRRRPLRSRGPRVTGMAVSGISGVGKTTFMEETLNLYPQVIRHREYRGQPLLFTQLVHLKLDCPPDGSVRGLCLSFFRRVDKILGTHYEDRYVRRKSNIDDLTQNMARVAAAHALGLLVIDELQCLAVAKSGGERIMLNHLGLLTNSVGVPVVHVGTPQMIEVLTREFRHGRRATGQGDLFFARMRDGTDPQDPNDPGAAERAQTQANEWRFFCESLWQYQYLRDFTPLTPKLSEILYQESQGITDVVVKLYMLAQHRAIQTGKERITTGLIRSVAADSLRSIRPALRALRDGDERKLGKMEDVLSRGLERIVEEGSRATSRLTRPSAGTNGAPSAPTPEGPAPTSPATPPVRLRRTHRSGTKPSTPGDLLWQLVSRGRAEGLSAHQTLLQAGLVDAEGNSR